MRSVIQAAVSVEHLGRRLFCSLLLGLALTVVGLEPVSVLAQEPAVPTTGALRRAAEVADARRTSEVIWVVLDNTHPFDVAFVTTDAGAAQDSADVDPIRIAIEIQTEYDMDLDDPARVIVMCHDEDSGGGVCMLPDPTIEISALDSVQVLLYEDAEVVADTVLIDVDALFIGISAFERFLLPYMSRMYGSTFADSVRADIVERTRNSRLVPPQFD